MSNPSFEIDVKEKISNSYNYELYKELERINFKRFKNTSMKGKHSKLTKGLEIKGSEVFQNSLAFTGVKNKLKEKLKMNYKTQIEAFQGCTRILLIVGQCFGLNPVLGVFETEISNIRFKICSFRNLYSVTLCVIQFIACMFCFFALIKYPISVATLAYFFFYFTTFYTNILFMVLARRWQLLNKRVALSRLDEYIDPYVRPKCIAIIIILLTLALFEHVLAIFSSLRLIIDCDESLEEVYRKFLERHFCDLVQIKTPYMIPVGVVVMFSNLMCTMNWNYSHGFVICISIYLTSILKGVNKKLISSEGQCLPSSFWKSLREDYNSATKLIRIFDENISSITLLAFASNLFFVCLQLYYVLATRFNLQTPDNEECTNQHLGPFSGNEHVLYFCFSLAYVLARSLAVSLMASGVHTASLVAAPVLYTVPSVSYGIEVQRFIEQVHGDTVALTGMNFFYVTRELVLSVAGTIITYELVLLQFNVDYG